MGSQDAVTGITFRVEQMISMGVVSNDTFGQSFVSFITEPGALLSVMLGGAWEFMPGVPHPRNLTGCDYLASSELKFILGMDLCSPEYYRSIRDICPISCGCGTMPECPFACNSTSADERVAIREKPELPGIISGIVGGIAGGAPAQAGAGQS